MQFVYLSAVLLSVTICAGFKNFYPAYPIPEADESYVGRPLILTPLIEAKKIREAQNLSQVTLPGVRIRSHSGYFTVNKKYNSNLFFWYFPNRDPRAPLLLWLQGGPGASSLFGLFAENGPFFLEQGKLTPRKFAWTETHSVIYIDNPVGTGFSFTQDDFGYARNETQVGSELYYALKQFFLLFPETQRNEFYISGESYAGKYVPALAITIHRENYYSNAKINLRGLAIGNGFSDPINQASYAPYLYQIGLFDHNQAYIFNKTESIGLNFIRTRQWEKAADVFERLLDRNDSLFQNFTGFKSYYNILQAKTPSGDFLQKFLDSPQTRRAIHVGNASYDLEAYKVEKFLRYDIYQSVAGWVSQLLSHYRVLLYTGQLDIIVAYPLTENYLHRLNFSGADAYRVAKRQRWYVGEELAGYVKYAGNLTEVLVRNAGHMVPLDQPLFAFDMITRFTHYKRIA